jgi:hypothetical protein
MKDVVAAIRIECLVKTVLLSKVATCVLGVGRLTLGEASRPPDLVLRELLQEFAVAPG